MKPISNQFTFALLGLSLAAGCTDISPFTGKQATADEINAQWDDYQQCAEAADSKFLLDAQAKTATVDEKVKEVEAQKSVITKLVNPSSDSAQATQATNDASGPLAAGLAVAGIALHSDNRRKDQAISASKLDKRPKKRQRKSGGAGANPVGVAPAAPVAVVPKNGTAKPIPEKVATPNGAGPDVAGPDVAGRTVVAGNGGTNGPQNDPQAYSSARKQISDDVPV
jgi:hypothetical protein